MLSKSQNFLFIAFAVVIIVALQAAFIVKETDQAMVIQFGEPVKLHTTPGLKFKIPFIQQARFFDRRVLDVDPVPEEVILSDQKRVVVDTFARYRITDMLQFYRALSTEQQAATRLNQIINSTMRSVLGNAELNDILSPKRGELMQAISTQVNNSVRRMGIEIVDVRIGRADLPEQTSQAIYARMRTEREREAAEFRAQGQEQAQEIRAKANRERTVLIATAEKEAQKLRGQGEAEATKIYADAFEKDPTFYAFYRTMEAYKKALPDEETTFILSPDGDFFKYFDKSGR